MRRLAFTGLFLAAFFAAGVGGYQLALHKGAIFDGEFLNAAAQSRSAAEPAGAGPIIYYRDPDDAAAYSATPRQTNDGRPYRAVRASEDVSFDKKQPQPATSRDASRKPRVLYYRNPMGLPDVSSVPKKDPMGMDYIPVFEGDEPGIVKVAPGRLQTTGFRSALVESRSITAPIRVPGTITLDERRVTVVATRSDAFVDKVENVTTGDRVTKGEPLLHLYSPEIVSAAAQLVASPGYEGSRRRLENLDVSPEVIAQIERTRIVPPTIDWLSPRDGVVLERNVVNGQKAAAGQVLFRIADLSQMWVLADVPEYDLGSVQIGDAATVHVRGLPNRVFKGQIELIYPEVRNTTRTTQVRIVLANTDGILRPDMYADVDIDTGPAEKVVAVPNDAIIDTGTRRIVLIDLGKGRFEPRDVTLGMRGDSFTQISSGLKDGERVVTGANFLIDSESNLKAALQGMTTEAKQ